MKIYLIANTVEPALDHGVAPDKKKVGSDAEPADASLAVELAAAPAGVGVVATSPALTPERGASVTQAERTASERTPTREERTEDM
jgi:hypothetical protein